MFDEIETATEAEVFEVLGRYTAGNVGVVEAAIELSIAPDVFRDILEQHDIAVREPSKQEIVENVAECLHEMDTGDGYQYSHSDEKQVEEGISAIIERVNVDTDQFRLSEQRLRKQIKESVWKAKSENGDTADLFWSDMDDIHRTLGTQDRTTYTIVFPLNVVFDEVERPDEYDSLGYSVQAISSDEWDDYCDRAYEAEQERAEESDVINDRNKLEEWFSDSPNQLDRQGQTYWLMEIDALDPRYASDRCVEALQYLLGRINFALTRNQLEGMQINSSVWNTRWQDLRLPFIYLVFEDSDYLKFSYSTDPTPRRSTILAGHDASRYTEYFDEILSLNGSLNEMEARLVKSMSSFQDGVTNTDRENAFLDYWRGAERLTLTTETDTTSTVVQRARTVARSSNVVSQSTVRDKRNKLVHEGDSVEITTDDTNTVKDMLEVLIRLYVDKSGEWGHEEFLFFFEHADKSDAALEHLEDDRQSDIDMVEEIRQMS
ncbi:hypothetical protein [Halapricum hydrolyticum]|uniref:Apea-like HEPN domain-containing protein n=1 Tax=Halapricum hydrolyticum TaxID=2979991 RepID=A0AAE3IEX7_9EURY|nr:hypothetical protein [Halapricum hydrolyticum]MCU4718138.1 hypothetical protein [Halapricum hydrolyticum]MCU4727354.1 hypothetical protein [Halapricum hydrolyticum]